MKLKYKVNSTGNCRLISTNEIISSMWILITILCLNFLTYSTIAFGSGIDRGVNAYKKGDYGTALKEWQPLAEQGIAKGQYFLGGLYSDGRGVTQDYKKAYKWYRLAAEQNFLGAQYELGRMYYFGRGIPQNYKKAADWYKLAAKQGDVSAQNSLGSMYNEGNGVPQDYKEAVRWYKLAAEQGSASAQGNLSVMYALGQGVLKDSVKALMWAKIAETNGSDLGTKLRDDFEKKITSFQIEEAQRLARECVNKNYKEC